MFIPAEIKRFLEDRNFCTVTDFAKSLKPRMKNGRKRK